MSNLNKIIKGAVWSGAVMGLAGCGMGDSGPSPHVVKQLAAGKVYASILQTGNVNLQIEAPIFGAPSPAYLRHKALLEKIETHKAHYLHKLESKMHEKGCTKAGDGTYNCSVILDNHNNTQKSTLIVTVDKAGRIWSLAGIKVA